MAAKVRRDLRVLAKHRLLSGPVEVDDQWARVISDALVFTLRGPTLDGMNEMMRGCGLMCDEAVAMDAINVTRAIIERKGRAAYRLISNRVRGEMLNVTLEEVIALGLTTMTPVDETQSEALQRRRHHRRDYAREYGRVRRAKAGAVPHAKSASRTKPWVKLGWSRATWYRRGKPKACEAHNIAPVQREHTREAAERMRRAKGAHPRAASPSAALRQIRQVAILRGLPRKGLKGSTSSFLTLNKSLTLRDSPSGAKKLQFVRRQPQGCMCRSSAAAAFGPERDAVTPISGSTIPNPHEMGECAFYYGLWSATRGREHRRVREETARRWNVLHRRATTRNEQAHEWLNLAAFGSRMRKDADSMKRCSGGWAHNSAATGRIAQDARPIGSRSRIRMRKAATRSIEG
jgi:hypothetical protein